MNLILTYSWYNKTTLLQPSLNPHQTARALEPNASCADPLSEQVRGRVA